MANRKRRVDAVSYTFHFYGCKDLIVKQEAGKTYVYAAVLLKRAKRLTNGYSQAVSSLYRDLRRAVSSKDIYGIRAICIEDFNREHLCCSVKVFEENGKDALMFTDEI